MPATNNTAARLIKILALAASALTIGNEREYECAVNCAREIAARDTSVDLYDTAFRVGLVLPRPAAPREIETGVHYARGHMLTRTVSADRNMEACTLNQHGRTECYMDEDNSGIRSFLGYADELDRDVWQQFAPLLRHHWRTHDRHYAV